MRLTRGGVGLIGVLVGLVCVWASVPGEHLARGGVHIMEGAELLTSGAGTDNRCQSTGEKCKADAGRPPEGGQGHDTTGYCMYLNPQQDCLQFEYHCWQCEGDYEEECANSVIPFVDCVTEDPELNECVIMSDFRCNDEYGAQPCACEPKLRYGSVICGHRKACHNVWF